MSLSITQIDNAKPGGRAFKLYDQNGLHLSIQPTGAKLWRLNYQYLGRQKTLHIGAWPAVDLAEARERRDQAKKQIASGLDPAREKRNAAMLAKLSADHTFRGIAEEWLEKCEREGRMAVTLRKIRWLLGKAYPMIGSMPITSITPQQILAVLKRVESAKRYESAARMRSIIGRVFRYAIATARADRDVTADLRGALVTPRTTHYAAITTEDGAGQLFRSIENYVGNRVTVLAMKLSAHLFVRPGELRRAEWSEIDWKNAVWLIPGEKMKMRRPHRVPLSRQAQQLIVELHALTGKWNYLFPSPRAPRNCMSDGTLNMALRRMGYSRKIMTAHGFRALAATLLNESGRWHPDAIERQLSHVEKSEVRRAYTRGEYWAERVRMMQFWSDYVDELQYANGSEPTAVVPEFAMLSGKSLLPDYRASDQFEDA